MTTPNKRLASKVAVVTGASKGIGAAIAKHLAAEGASVVVNYSSSKTGADKVVAEITSAGGKAVVVQADMAKKADIERLFAEAEKAFGRLDILVNNAGIYEFAPLENVTEELFHKQFKSKRRRRSAASDSPRTSQALRSFSPHLTRPGSPARPS